MARNALENHKKNLGHNLFRFNLPVKLKNSNLIGPKYMFVPSCREVKASTGSFCFLG